MYPYSVESVLHITSYVMRPLRNSTTLNTDSDLGETSCRPGKGHDVIHDMYPYGCDIMYICICTTLRKHVVMYIQYSCKPLGMLLLHTFEALPGQPQKPKRRLESRNRSDFGQCDPSSVLCQMNIQFEICTLIDLLISCILTHYGYSRAIQSTL